MKDFLPKFLRNFLDKLFHSPIYYNKVKKEEKGKKAK